MANHRALRDAFASYFSFGAQFVVRAPGRVNLIGEHTDYNDGYVLPMAIDRSLWIALSPRDDRRVRVWSLDFQEERIFELDHLENNDEGWVEYLKGVAWALEESGSTPQGWDGILTGEVPLGAGLSSSAALEMASTLAFAVVSDLDWNPVKMAQLGQKAENEWVGVSCGIMDQMVSAAGKAGHAMLLDCRDLSRVYIPVPREVSFVVMDTKTRHSHTDSGYNQRREECEIGARFFGVSHLRDLDLTTFRDRSAELDPVIRRRVRHILKENQRVLGATCALKDGDLTHLGELMNESHRSLQEDFEVSTQELDRMVELAQKQPGCYGARLTGGGFGGSAVAMVDSSVAVEFTEIVGEAYQASTGNVPRMIVCHASQGAEVIYP